MNCGVVHYCLPSDERCSGNRCCEEGNWGREMLPRANAAGTISLYAYVGTVFVCVFPSSIISPLSSMPVSSNHFCCEYNYVFDYVRPLNCQATLYRGE